MGLTKTTRSISATGLLLLIMMTVGLYSCTRTQKDIIPSADYAPYVNAYTGGVISQNSTIRIELTHDQPMVDLNSELKNNPFSFSPSLKGKAYWVSNNTIEFVPEEGTLKPGTLYEGTFQLGDFIEVDKKLKEFNFSFRVQERNFTLQLESLPITATQPDEINIKGGFLMNAVILLSGGLDSTTCMAVAKQQGYDLYPISFDYHQRNKIELEGAKEIAKFFGAKRHLIIDTNMNAIGGSALTDENIKVPEGNVGRKDNDVPVTYVPSRNLIFLSYALGYAEVVKADAIFIGVNAVDFSGYPDCRPEFIQKFQDMADYACKTTAVDGKKIKIVTPLQSLSKKEIIQLGTKLGAPYHLTRSCYNGREKACGVCDSCKLRLRGFAEAGIKDPIAYEKNYNDVTKNHIAYENGE